MVRFHGMRCIILFCIFNPVTQSKKYDPEGNFIRKNIPELAGFSRKRIHWPQSASLAEQNSAHCILGKDYPSPLSIMPCNGEKL